MNKLRLYRRESRHLRGKDLKISLSRRITSETAQLKFLMENKPKSNELTEQMYLVSQLRVWRNSLN
jgi:hypothetical protein